MSLEVLDPTYGGGGQEFQPAPRLAALEGKTVGVISNGKKGTKPFFDALERFLLEEVGVAKVEIAVKANYSAPAEAAVMARVGGWDAAFTGIGD